MNSLPQSEAPAPLPVGYWLVPLAVLVALVVGMVVFRDQVVAGFATRLFAAFIC